MSKNLSLIIRSHGGIPSNYIPQTLGNQIFDIYSLSDFQIKELNVISLAKLGGVCYGNSEVQKFMKQINNYYKNNPIYEDKVYEVFFNESPPNKIQKIREELFGNSFDPEMVTNKMFFLNKLYNRYDKNSGIFIFSINASFENEETTQIKSKLQNLTNKLLGGENIYRKEIFEELTEFNIDKLNLIDLTCSAYYEQINPPYPLNVDTVNWMNSYLVHNNLKGGYKIINKSTKNKSSKNKSSKNKSSKSRRKQLKIENTRLVGN